MSLINSGSVDEHCPAFKKSIKLKGPGAEAFVVIDSFLGGGGNQFFFVAAPGQSVAKTARGETNLQRMLVTEPIYKSQP